MNESMFTILTVVVLVVAIFFVARAIGRAQKPGKDANRPLQRVNARVTGRRNGMGVRSMGSSGFTQALTRGHAMPEFCLRFQLEDGPEMEFQVEAEDFGRIPNGARGVLCYRGETFEGFEMGEEVSPGEEQVHGTDC